MQPYVGMQVLDTKLAISWLYATKNMWAHVNGYVPQMSVSLNCYSSDLCRWLLFFTCQMSFSIFGYYMLLKCDVISFIYLSVVQLVWFRHLTYLLRMLGRHIEVCFWTKCMFTFFLFTFLVIGYFFRWRYVPCK